MNGAWPFWKSIPRFDREYSLADLGPAMSALFSAPDEDASWIRNFYSPRFFQFVRSGTECLYLILKLLKLRPKSRVGVPLYCCSAVFEAIAAAGHVPAFLDVDLDSYALDVEFLRQRRNQLDALVVVHVFGYPTDFKALRDALEGRDIPIIEDCAHSLFSESQNRLTGSCTDASFLTFGMHKPAAVGGGAVLLINDAGLADSAKRELHSLSWETKSREFRHSMICLARSISYHRATYGALLASPLGHGRDNGRWTPRENGASLSDREFTPSGIRAVDRVLVERRVQEFQKKMPLLEDNARKLRAALVDSPLAFPSEPAFGKWNHFLVPVRFPTPAKRESGRRFLVQRRVDTAPLYQNCARNAARFGYAGDCPKAERVAKTVCTVPNHAWLTKDEITYIAEALRHSVDVS